MDPVTTRRRFAAGFLICAGLILMALWLQATCHLAACPLCIFQRVAFMVTGVLFLAGALQGPGRRGAHIYAALTLMTSLAGAGIALRHVWLLHLPPDQVPECGPGLSWLLHTQSLPTVIVTVLRGTADCAAMTWTLFGLTLPAWALIWFLLLALLSATTFRTGSRKA